MAQPNPYIGYSSAELATVRAALVAADLALIKAGNYSISNRSKSADPQIAQKLAWVNEAMRLASGTRISTTFADFSAA